MKRAAVILAAVATVSTSFFAGGSVEVEGPVLFHTHERADEPTIGVDPQGRVFYQTWDATLGSETPVLVSTDNGATWSRVPADAHGATGSGPT